MCLATTEVSGGDIFTAALSIGLHADSFSPAQLAWHLHGQVSPSHAACRRSAFWGLPHRRPCTLRSAVVLACLQSQPHLHFATTTLRVDSIHCRAACRPTFTVRPQSLTHSLPGVTHRAC